MRVPAAALGILLLSGALLSCPSRVPAATGEDIQQDIREKRKDLEDIRKKLKDEERRKTAARNREKSTLSRLERMDRDLERLNRERRVNRKDLVKTRSRILDLEVQTREATGRLESFREDLRQRLRALYRAGLEGNLLSFWLGSKTPGEVSRELKFETLLARSNERLLHRTLEERERLSDSRRSLLSEEKRRTRILDALTRQKKRTQGQRRDRARLLVSLRKEQALRDRTIRDLREASRNLQSTVRKLLQQAETARKTDQWQSAGKGLGALRGRLAWPVGGRVISPFGRHKDKEFNTTFENTGIQIRAAAGTPVRAVAGGRVRYSDWFKGFGKLVILDHGEGYYSLYAQASEVYVAEGDAVTAGQTIAAVGDTGSLVGNALYFELRKDGLPVNPSLWLRK